MIRKLESTPLFSHIRRAFLAGASPARSAPARGMLSRRNSTSKSDLPCSWGRLYTDIFAEMLFMTARDEFDPLAPQREAAFFYGLFLRGHDVAALRQDIDVPRSMLDKWMRARDFEASFRENLHRVYSYRKQVLAIFDGLVLNEQSHPRLQ